MAASTLEYIDVTITRDIQVVSRVGFGSLLFIGPTTGSQSDIVDSYSSLEGVAAVFADTTPEYKAAQLYFGQTQKPSRLYIGTKGAAETYVQALQAILALNSDFYAIAIASVTKADIAAMAAYVQTLDKIFLASSADSDIKASGTSDLASDLLGLSYDRTALFYHSGATTTVKPEVAWAGLCLPQDPGSISWAWKTLSGIPADNTTAVERGYLEQKNATYYASVGGNNVTFDGAVSYPGVYIDIIRGTDWIRYRLSEDLVATLANAGKIPYIGGDAVIEGAIRGRLASAAANGIIADDYSVSVPPASEQSASDRVARIYNNVKFYGTFTGAVHKVSIQGSFQI